MPFGHAVVDGHANLDHLQILPLTKTVLLHQWKHIKPPVPKAKLDFEWLMDGFRKWPKWTSTSPSSRHLGIYKSLLKDVHTGNEKQPTTKGINIMWMIFQMLKLAAKHTHSFQRWCMIWNMFLEKRLGFSKIILPTSPTHWRSWL